MTTRKVICAGCSNLSYADKTTFYRNKRWCGKQSCKDKIDIKVKHSNYMKAKKKMKKGTFRHGVEPGVREYIKERDSFMCRNCYKSEENFNLQVHHIVPVSNGGEDKHENLIVLCYECHTIVHQQGWEKYVDKFNNYTKQTHTKNYQ